VTKAITFGEWKGDRSIHSKHCEPSVRVQNDSQSVCLAVRSRVKFRSTEIIASPVSQNFQMPLSELCEDLRKIRNNPRIEGVTELAADSGPMEQECIQFSQ
jgi:hypothetical protein